LRPGTIEAVGRAAAGDPRVRLVVGDQPGPTTKAGCLNWIWQAMLDDERADGVPIKAVVLHDAEDVVHPDELTVYDALIERFALVQIPVHAEPVRGAGFHAALISSHYCSEFFRIAQQTGGRPRSGGGRRALRRRRLGESRRAGANCRGRRWPVRSAQPDRGL
jgi:hypothetical protein